VLIVWISSGLDLLWRTPHLSSEFIRSHSDHRDHPCSRGGVGSGGDDIDTNTRVYASRHAWVHAVMSYFVCH
jgi:hypothetical protein